MYTPGSGSLGAPGLACSTCAQEEEAGLRCRAQAGHGRGSSAPVAHQHGAPEPQAEVSARGCLCAPAAGEANQHRSLTSGLPSGIAHEIKWAGAEHLPACGRHAACAAYVGDVWDAPAGALVLAQLRCAPPQEAGDARPQAASAAQVASMAAELAGRRPGVPSVTPAAIARRLT